jgi:hypothetical protein
MVARRSKKTRRSELKRKEEAPGTTLDGYLFRATQIPNKNSLFFAFSFLYFLFFYRKE